MEDIFDLQWKLNTYTLRKLGLDFGESIRDSEQKPVWIENYRKALSAELAELIREVKDHGMGTDNGKIEIVDMLHFLVSLSHIVELKPSDLPESAVSATGFDDCAIQTFLALDDLQNSLKWKWWARGGGYQPEKAKHSVTDLWKCFVGICALFHLDMETVKRIYIAKNKVNFRRQDQNYNEDTKTERDNEDLKNIIG
jgi:dimeric dUTPase (all-alpha-NTP-PPase superfamily)